MMPRFPSLEDWLFSARSFAAAALALWIAFSLDLSRPYWAMTTVFIVSQPFAGALRAKALWRLVGTVGGAAFSVAVLPNLVNAPELMALALSAWIGLCLTASFYDPTPRAYAFMLSGYSAALTCFPIIDNPGTVFDTAVNRVLEISLGILCAYLLHGVLLPRHGAPRLLAGSRTWLADLARFAADSLTAPHDPERFSAERRRIARDGAALALLFQQTRYEARGRQAQQLWLPRLHRHARALPTLLTAIGERNRALAAQDPAAAEALRPLLADIAAWLGDSVAPPPGPGRLLAAQRLSARLAEAAQHPGSAVAGATSPHGINPWATLLREGLLHRLEELLEHWRETLLLTERLLAERPAATAPAEEDAPPGHLDPLLVALSGLAAALAVLLGSLIWIGTGWSHGASLAMMSAVGLCIFGALDDPAPALRKFLMGACAAVVIAMLYQFAILPHIDGFPLLLLVLAPLFLCAGALIPQPAQMGWALAVCATVPAVLTLQESFSADFAASADGGLATAGGLLLSLVLARLVRSLGVGWRVRRLAEADRRDLARLATGRGPAEIRRLLGTMLDRFEALAARLGAADAGAVRVEELADLRAAVNVLRLRNRLPDLPAEARAATEDMLAALAREARGEAPRDSLRAPLDRALALCAAAGSRSARLAALSLSGLRLALLPDAPPPALPSSLPFPGDRSLAA
ncbi:FUSC family protein [Teichococcus vastitatis]|uniref:FUSC family protein n=1 Tax=Teichococcus vastitatis TaxID=2307076 RepID=A0ABS9WB60_9PROT|nr:FUSC family protein [Pseudoroseomonas vastitatis]MCI0756463.1 FUSC family protein [Pseudoroseomonas vastitatis]